MKNTHKIALALTVVACISLAATAQIGAGRGSNADPRLVNSMDDSGYNYEIDSDDDAKVILEFDDNRTHAVWANTLTETHEGIEIREVWGIVGEYPSPDAIPNAVLLDLMTANFNLKFGKYALFVQDSGAVRIRFITTVSAELDGATLGKIIKFVGIIADEKEIELEDFNGVSGVDTW